MNNKTNEFLNYFVLSLIINVVIYSLYKSKNKKQETSSKDYLKITISFLKVYPISIIIVIFMYLINNKQKNYKPRNDIKIITQADINDIKAPFLVGRDLTSVYKNIPDYKNNSLKLRDNISRIPFNKQ